MAKLAVVVPLHVDEASLGFDPWEPALERRVNAWGRREGSRAALALRASISGLSRVYIDCLLATRHRVAVDDARYVRARGELVLGCSVDCRNRKATVQQRAAAVIDVLDKTLQAALRSRVVMAASKSAGAKSDKPAKPAKANRAKAPLPTTRGELWVAFRGKRALSSERYRSIADALERLIERADLGVETGRSWGQGGCDVTLRVRDRAAAAAKVARYLRRYHPDLELVQGTDVVEFPPQPARKSRGRSRASRA